MSNLQKIYQQAMAKKRAADFDEQVKQSNALRFSDACRKIGFNNPNLVFSDNKNSIYQLRIVKKTDAYEVVQDRVDRKTLKSLLGTKSDELVSTVLEYADAHRQLKNPVSRLNYGFYYRRYGCIEMHDVANFDNQIAMYNNASGEVKIFSALPERVKQNYLNLFTHCLTPNYTAFLDWLALYAMEIRRGLKKPFLCLHGDFYYPIICLIENIYPQAFVINQTKTLPAMLKYKNWEAKCFVMTSNAVDYRRLAKLSNMFAQTEHDKVGSNTYMIQVHLQSRIKNIQYAEASCFNVMLYDKNTQLNNLKAIGIDGYQNVIKEQIGGFCRNNLNERYKMLVRDEVNLINKFGIEFRKQDDAELTDKQVRDLFNHIIAELKIVESEYFRQELFEFLKFGVISVSWIRNICIQYAIKTDYFIRRAIDLGLFLSFQSVVEVGEENRIGYKVNEKKLEVEHE